MYVEKGNILLKLNNKKLFLSVCAANLCKQAGFEGKSFLFLVHVFLFWAIIKQ